MTDSNDTQPRPRGHVEETPEARPLPPAWRDHFRGPIPGMPAGLAPTAASAASQSTGQSGQSPRASQTASGAAPQPAQTPQSAPTQPSSQPAAGQSESSPLEPHPAFQPDVNRPIPLYGDRQQGGGEERQRRTGWDAANWLKPLAAGAALLAVAGVRRAARGVSQLADALASRRRQ